MKHLHIHTFREILHFQPLTSVEDGVGVELGMLIARRSSEANKAAAVPQKQASMAQVAPTPSTLEDPVSSGAPFPPLESLFNKSVKRTASVFLSTGLDDKEEEKRFVLLLRCATSLTLSS